MGPTQAGILEDGQVEMLDVHQQTLTDAGGHQQLVQIVSHQMGDAGDDEESQHLQIQEQMQMEADHHVILAEADGHTLKW